MLFAFYYILKIIMEFYRGYFPASRFDAHIPLRKNPLGALKNAALIK